MYNPVDPKDKNDIVVLAIESSCDETACAVVKNGREVLASTIATQIEIHKRFGGVVPEIASRNHTMAIETVVNETIEKSGLSIEEIDAIAVTYGAGLLGALLVGVNYAKGLAYAYNKPLYGISHIRGHIAANYIGTDLKPPYLCLLASGGHTAVLNVKSYTEIEALASSKDDAAGEAFDKVARVLSLPYPGGPEIEKLAKQGKANIEMPCPTFTDKDELWFSFSGIKTFVINYAHKLEQKGESMVREDVAASFQEAAVTQLFNTTLNAARRTGAKDIAIAGGVSANLCLRSRFDSLKEQGYNIYYPQLKYCTDNAAMIGAEAYYAIKSGTKMSPLSLDAKATVPLK
ncbi:MAG: tRNA (adenosine(37)-N6)-threonylcarbamoyltransferase complex transferase subunit TsaD [Clostridia bacterium]|nr:tRNA (adenosine(37)-N6)-threonylcarbamoyltransferase complex transferase subunit TsaD [Clostridia bacterium]